MNDYKKYFSFEGTATRSEYWAMVVISIVAYIVGMIMIEANLLLGMIVLVPVLWYNLATTVRRLRDTGLSIWWMLVLLVPFVSNIAAIVFGILKSKDS